MGERLAVNISRDRDVIACIYYHWGAYTESALEIAQDIIDNLGDYKAKSTRMIQYDLIRFCEENGGGIASFSGIGYSERTYVEDIFPHYTFKKDGIDRNDGLIALSPRGCMELEKYALTLDINLDEDTVTNYIYGSAYENYKCYKEDDFYGVNDILFNNIMEIPCDLSYFPIDEMHELYRTLRENCNAPVVRYGDEIFTLITC